MICSKCGKEIADDSTVCPECQAVCETQEQAENTVSASEAKTEDAQAADEVKTTELSGKAIFEAGRDGFEKTKSAFLGLSRNLKIAVLAVVAIALITIIASCCGGKGKFTYAELGKGYYFDVSEELLVNVDGNAQQLDESVSEIYYSADCSLTAVLDKDDTLYIMTKKGAKKVADDVDYAVVSFYGDTIAYVAEVEEKVGALYLYNVAKGKEISIDEEAYYRGFVLSPDGKSIAYVGNVEFSGYDLDEFDLYLSKNGKAAEKLYSNSFPLAITDGGKHVFYVKDKEKLYLDDERVAASYTYGSGCYFNRDCTELIYEREESTYYYTLKMDSPVKLKGATMTDILVPEEVAQESTRAVRGYAYHYGVDTFDKTLIEMDDTVYVLKDKGETVEKIAKFSSYQLSKDGESLIYLDNDGNLKYIKNVFKSTETKQLGKNLDAEGFVASKDLKKVYYEADEELFFLDGEKGVRVADEADDYCYSDKYGVIYFICDGELFYATTKAKSKERVYEENVVGIVRFNDEVLFIHLNDDGDEITVLKMTGKKKTEVLAESEFDY